MSHNISPTMTLLPGGPDDSYAVFQVFNNALADLSTRLGVAPAYRTSEAEQHNRMWTERQPLYEYLAQLTELFSLPEAQSRGLGWALLERVFPPGGRAPPPARLPPGLLRGDLDER